MDVKIKTCCVANCLSSSIRQEDRGVTFHKLPKDTELRALWCRVTRYNNTLEKPYVCSRHFYKADFDYKEFKYVLRPGAIPAIFSWNLYKIAKNMENKIAQLASTDDKFQESEDNDDETIANIKREIEQQSAKQSTTDEQGAVIHNMTNDTVLTEQSPTTEPDALQEVTDKSPTNDKSITVVRSMIHCTENDDLDDSCNDLANSSSEEVSSIFNQPESFTIEIPPLKNTHDENLDGDEANFSVGSLVEAKDFDEVWHVARILEEDIDEMEVLVRYESGIRNDEWINTTSSRIRKWRKIPTVVIESLPLTKHSKSAVEDPKTPLSYMVGERCYARWGNNRKFPATVHAVIDGDRYQVVFDDGITCIQPGHCLSKQKKGAPPVDLQSNKPYIQPGATPIHRHLFDPKVDHLGSKSERRMMKKKLDIKVLFNIGKKSYKRKTSAIPEKPARMKKFVRKRPAILKSSSAKVVEIPILNMEDIPEPISVAITEPKPIKVEDRSSTSLSAVEKVKKIPKHLRQRKSNEQAYMEYVTGNSDRLVVTPVIKHETHKKEVKEEVTEKTDDVIDESGYGMNIDDGLNLIAEAVASFEAEKSDHSEPVLLKIEPKTEPMPDRYVGELPEGQWCCRWVDGEPQGEIVEEPDTASKGKEGETTLPRKSVMVEDKRLPPGWKKMLVRRCYGSSAGKWDVVLVDPNNRRLRDKGEMRNYISINQNEDLKAYENALSDFSVHRKLAKRLGWDSGTDDKSTLSSLIPTPAAVKKSPSTLSSDGPPPKKKKKQPVPLIPVAPQSAPASPDVAADAALAPHSAPIPSPSKLLSSPSKLIPSPSDPIASPSKLLSSPSEPIASPSMTMASPCKTIQSPPKTIPSPSKPIASPSKTIAQPGALLGPIAPLYLPSDTQFFEGLPYVDGHVYVGSMKVQIIENLFRCPADGCYKNFRKDNLLRMHIKHYHRELRKLLGDTPKVSDLAYQRTKIPEDTIVPKLRCESELKSPKIKPPPKMTTEKKESEAQEGTDQPTTPVKVEGDTLPESPKLRSALEQQPSKRPKVLHPAKKEEAGSPGPEEVPEVWQKEDMNAFVRLHKLPDNVETKTKVKLPKPLRDQTDFETAISTHTVTKSAFWKRKPRPKKKKDSRRREGDKQMKKKKRIKKSVRTKWTDVEVEVWQPPPPGPELWQAPVIEPVAALTPAPIQPLEPQFMISETGERIKIVHMKREEIINCHCGICEEDGLMIQCDLCLCWQHAICHGYDNNTVPDKYTCSICLHPRRGRASRRYVHDQAWLYEGRLPGAATPDQALRRAHELTGNLLRLTQLLHTLRLKFHVATKKDHPKQYLWAKDWESEDRPELPHVDLHEVFREIGKENLPAPTEELVDGQREQGELGSQALLANLLASPNGTALDLPISTSELERLAKSVQEAEALRGGGPEPEAAIESSACRKHLLRHIQRLQALVDARLDSIEAQVAELESQDPSFEDDETPEFFPRTKQTIRMLHRDLATMEELGTIT